MPNVQRSRARNAGKARIPPPAPTSREGVLSQDVSFDSIARRFDGPVIVIGAFSFDFKGLIIDYDSRRGISSDIVVNIPDIALVAENFGIAIDRILIFYSQLGSPLYFLTIEVAILVASSS